MSVPPRNIAGGGPTRRHRGPIQDMKTPPSALTRELQRLITQGELISHLQPIADLRTGAVYGHEALIRGPVGSPLATPEALFTAAQAGAMGLALEHECLRQALRSWSTTALESRLFVNLSAQGVQALFCPAQLARTLDLLCQHGVEPAQLVIELTEQERVDDVAGLRASVRLAAEKGIRLALDDFGDGRSSLRLWSELKPALVKIDKYFTRGLAHSPDKLQTFRALLQIAETFGTSLVAEGIEQEEELRLLRDLGVELGQGWLLGRPTEQPVTAPLPRAMSVIASRRVSVMPEQRWAHDALRCGLPARWVEPVGDMVTNDVVLNRFTTDPALLALPVVDAAGHVLGLIDRHAFESSYARLYFRELHGRLSCLTLAHTAPLCVEEDAPIDTLIDLLANTGQRYLRQGFLVTRAGVYQGLGSCEALVKAVTEWRLQVARHANPLTQLPGNIPISLHLEQLLQGGGAFVVAHLDLDRFKPFNDRYGYRQGDEMIRLAADVIVQGCDPQCDFVGHVGGDDFIVLFQSEDWLARCEHIVRTFNTRAAALLADLPGRTGARTGHEPSPPLDPHEATTISVGAVAITAAAAVDAQDVAEMAARAKKLAKQRQCGVHVLQGATAAGTLRQPRTPLLAQ
jgi:EAL domain-containing protein (putative c-di-GMP-specific phosphodiesterase class I)/GGDEF domain-containing protein